MISPSKNGKINSPMMNVSWWFPRCKTAACPVECGAHGGPLCRIVVEPAWRCGRVVFEGSFQGFSMRFPWDFYGTFSLLNGVHVVLKSFPWSDWAFHHHHMAGEIDPVHQTTRCWNPGNMAIVAICPMQTIFPMDWINVAYISTGMDTIFAMETRNRLNMAIGHEKSAASWPWSAALPPSTCAASSQESWETSAETSPRS